MGPYVYQIYSQRQQGLAETSRLILEVTGTQYENVFVQVMLPLAPGMHI